MRPRRHGRRPPARCRAGCTRRRRSSGGSRCRRAPSPSGSTRAAGTARRRAGARRRSRACSAAARRRRRGGRSTAGRAAGPEHGLVDRPVLLAGDLQHEHVVHVVVRVEAARRRRRDVGVDLAGCPRSATSWRVKSTSGGQVRCRPWSTSVAPSANSASTLSAPTWSPTPAPAPPGAVNRLGASTAPSLAIRMNGVRSPRAERARRRRPAEEVGEVLTELGGGGQQGARPPVPARERPVSIATQRESADRSPGPRLTERSSSGAVCAAVVAAGARATVGRSFAGGRAVRPAVVAVRVLARRPPVPRRGRAVGAAVVPAGLAPPSSGSLCARGAVGPAVVASGVRPAVGRSLAGVLAGSVVMSSSLIELIPASTSRASAAVAVCVQTTREEVGINGPISRGCPARAQRGPTAMARSTSIRSSSA